MRSGTDEQPGSVQPAAHCPVCGCPVGEPRVTCPRCDTPHHPECWKYAGRCAIFGCEEGTRLPVTGVPAREALTRWTAYRDSVVRWYWLFRIHWALFAVIALSMAVFFLDITISLVAGSVLPRAWGDALYVVPLVIGAGSALLATAAIPLYLLLLPLSGPLASGLQEDRNGSTSLPRDRVRGLLDRLDLPAEVRTVRGICHGLGIFLNGLVGAAILAIGLAFFFPARALTAPIAALIPFLLLQRGLIAAIGWVGEARALYLGSLQNRILVSFKKGDGSLPEA